MNTVNEVAAKYEGHPVQVVNWKKELLDRVPEVFEPKNAKKDKTVGREREQLERKVDQLTMEVDWLEKSATGEGPKQLDCH